MTERISQQPAGVKSEATEIVRFQFQGDWLEGMRTEVGAMFPLRPLCRALGIDPANQREKLQKQAWATGVLITSVGEDLKKREMFSIDRRTLLMWLATIDANRVAEAVRPKLVAYQKDIAETIDRVFFGPPPAREGVTPEQMSAAFAQALQIALPTILATVDRRIVEVVDAAIARRAASESCTIGRQRAKILTARMRDMAEKRSVACRESLRRSRGIL